MISTEGRNERTTNIDKEDSFGIIKLINDEDKTVAIAVEKALLSIAKVVDASYETLKNKGRIFYIGAGTSGRLGVLDASEMPPTFNVSNDMIIGIIAGGELALRNPIEGAEDSETEAENDLKKYNFNENDMLIGIAASGRTPYVIGGLEYANDINAKTASISTSSNSKIGKIAKLAIEAVVGPETITGSTRMKSGTAQKMVLNMISTGTMIKLGKVYENWMIDVKASNDKLVERAIQMVINITNESRDIVISRLEECDFSPKLAVVMIKKGITKEEAIFIIEENNGKIGEIL